MAKTKSKQKRKRFLVQLKWKRQKKKMKETALINTPPQGEAGGEEKKEGLDT